MRGPALALSAAALLVAVLPTPTSSLANGAPARSLGQRRTYFACRHTYESTLRKELERVGASRTSSPCPGLVAASDAEGLDPAYALQTLPDAHAVSGESAKDLATAALAALPLKLLAGAPRGSLVTHCLVPDTLKGRPAARAQWHARATRGGEMVTATLKKSHPCARRASVDFEGDPVLLQLLLLDAENLVVSLAPSRRVPAVGGRWPGVEYPGGFADASDTNPDVESDKAMAGSAYRKLLEALACAGESPQAGDTAVDLGAAPGSWTQALLRLGCESVTAVDRSSLAPQVLKDRGVDFVQGDAFTFPPRKVDWLVSDVIAFPDRVVEIIDSWSGMAKRMVLTMKFTGDEPDWEALLRAKQAAQKRGYALRAKHFFANKNEVTLMLAPAEAEAGEAGGDSDQVWRQMGPVR